MLLIELTLQAQTPIPLTPQKRGFPGGILHGWFEAIISRTNPDLWQTLRGIKNQSARYALRVPSVQTLDQSLNIHLGLMLFEPVQHHWSDILQALNCTHTSHLGHTHTPVHIIDPQLSHPNHCNITLLHASTQQGAQQLTAPIVPPQASEAQHITIQLKAPTLINSQKRRESLHITAQAQPFSLSSIIRSLQRRTTELEPTLAEHYAFDTPAWQDAVRQTWPHQHPVDCQLQNTNWLYASRNTPGHCSVLIPAISGKMCYKGPIPAPVVSLLKIGQWIGIGQKNSLGMGWYEMRED